LPKGLSIVANYLINGSRYEKRTDTIMAMIANASLMIW
jgi:hypothetical protein